MGALLPYLKQLQLGQLVRAGAALLAYGGNPSKPWAGLWFVALQVGVDFGTAVFAADLLGAIHETQHILAPLVAQLCTLRKHDVCLKGKLCQRCAAAPLPCCLPCRLTTHPHVSLPPAAAPVELHF
jgi:hypothetical protein